MSIDNLLAPCETDKLSVEGILGLLEQYGAQALIYPGGCGPHLGYIFRGELDYPQPLQSSLERVFFEKEWKLTKWERRS
jgi:hypothetical protein